MIGVRKVNATAGDGANGKTSSKMKSPSSEPALDVQDSIPVKATVAVQ
jgi:hypothetical protein